MSSRTSVRDFYLWGVLLFVAVVGILAMPAQQYRADPMAIQYEVARFINTGELGVPADLATAFGGDPGQYFVENTARHRWFSKYGVFNDVMSFPPLFLESIWRGGPVPYIAPSGDSLRLVILNLYNIVLSLGVAFYLYRLACGYTRSRWIAVFFVFSSLYCTYWWFYLRAQNSEIYQTLFMLGFFYHFTTFFRVKDEQPKAARSHLLRAGLFLGALMLVKSLFIVVIPVCGLALAYAAYRESRDDPGSTWYAEALALGRPAAWLAVPLTISFALLLLANWYKFGSPLETGYSEWGESHHPIFSGNFFLDLGYLFFGVQGNIFLHFPLLIFALFGYYGFARRWPFDLLLVLLLAALVFAIDAKFRNWIGWWCYGPRYVITVLPLLSLPFLLVLEFLLDHYRRWWSGALTAVILACLLFSFWLQFNTNSLRFFTYFDLLSAFSEIKDPRVGAYLDDNPFGIIYHDLRGYAAGQPWEVATLLGADDNEKQRQLLHAFVQQLTISNFYWWQPEVQPATVDQAR